MVNKLLFVLFAHYIGDWGLQNEFVATNKGKYGVIMFSHCMVWTGCISVALLYFKVFVLWKALFLLFGHWYVDQWKCDYLAPVCDAGSAKHNLRLLHLDQLWHVIQCLVVVVF